MKKISSIKVQNYLELNGIYPDYTVGDVAYYYNGKRFREVYNNYVIEINFNKKG